MTDLAAQPSASPSPRTTNRACILIVEDEPHQRAGLATALNRRGYDVLEADTGGKALQVVAGMQPDVVLLDLGLPDVDGPTLCRHLRLLVDCPLVVVTADAVEGRVVELLDLGADDYVLKPFRMDELLARVRVALRHRLQLACIVEDSVIVCGDLRIDVAAHQLYVADEPVEVQRRQFDLLVALARNEGKVMTFTTLGRRLWGLEATDDTRAALRTVVSKLRRTLGAGSRRPTLETENHVGYRLTVPATG